MNLKKRNRNINTFIMLIEKYGIFIVLIVFSVIFGSFKPKFLTVQKITNISMQVVPIGILAIGAMFVIITGGIDLTAGVGISLSAMMMEAVFRPTKNVGLAVIMSIAVVLLLGVFNGLLITKVKLGPVITTLIMMTVVQGTVYMISKWGVTINISNPAFNYIARGKIIGIPVSFLIMLLIYFIGYVGLNHTRLGFYLIAIGNNPEGARLAGISVYRYLFFPYIISGLSMGLAALVIVARVNYINASLGGMSLLLDAIAAVIIGGVAISGGKGSIEGVLIGSIAIAIINNMVNIVDIRPEWNEFFKGLIIVMMMLINRSITVIEEKRK
jgi:ribose/xylose/arabinose/galactoside ABC-type transport system permease subunit